jgi:RNA polymerase sigma-70 factor (ECF subfamily)
VRVAETELVAAARAGDETAFTALTEPYARELQVHCYRMLGSLPDAEDALQETLLRAWRHLGSFEGRSSVRGWLYKVATNVCLTASERRRRREPPAPSAPPIDMPHLGPYPDELLEDLEDREPTPAARYDLRESVQLAFLAAIQLLPARQRAVLLLRDVLGWSAQEVADLLETSVVSANSALQRARETLDRHRREGRLRTPTAPTGEQERSLLRRYVETWDAVDIDGFVALLREDAVLWMPPESAQIVGRGGIGAFFATVPADGELDKLRLVETRANRRPALAAYLWDADERVYRPYGLMVLTIDGGAISEITGFPDPALFDRFGLPPEIR